MLRKISHDCPPRKNDAVFCEPEVLLLENLRLWSQSTGMYPYIRRRMIEALGERDGVRAAKAIKMMAHILGLNARRTFYLMLPGTRGATADERALLALIGAVLTQRRTQANAIATWLLPYNCHGTFLAVAGELGRAMKAGGQEIAPPRDIAVPQTNHVRMEAVA